MEKNEKGIEVKSRFGNCVIPAEDVILFPEGIIGSQDKTQFALLTIDEETPFLVLQSLQDENVCFLLTNPLLFMNEYSFELSDKELFLLQANDKNDIIFLTILTIPEGYPEASHLFLLAPMIINMNRRRAIQIVNPAYEGDKATFLLNLNTEKNKASAEESNAVPAE